MIWSGDPLDLVSRVERALIQGDEIYAYDGGEALFADP